MNLVKTGQDIITEKARNLITSQHIMTLAVEDEGQPWAAPVYYVFWAGCFWFFSSMESRHIRCAQRSGRAAAAIHTPSRGWQDIKGVQMEGTIEPGGFGLQSIQAFQLYMMRFSFIGDMLPVSPVLASIKDLESVFKARWYRFVPQNIIYTDNEIHFGFRQQLDLERL